MSGTVELDEGRGRVDEGGRDEPGLALIFSRLRACHVLYPLGGRSLLIGRDRACDIALGDSAVSAQHARVTREPNGWTVEDLASRNGTHVDGTAVRGAARGQFRVLRVGASILLFERCVAWSAARPLAVTAEVVSGPSTRRVFEEIEGIARVSSTLHVTGESGTGKELAARAFHARGPRPQGPFVAVNCATVPRDLAERLFFGARKGAFSGADADVGGYVQAADGGTLFLDEVGELDPLVQAKLLRVLDSREVIPLGATRSRPVDVRVCSATLESLRGLVAAGRFREDLYFRLGRPHVEIPALRERLEEIPWLVERALERAAPGLSARPSLVEECLLRPWPGNVRELQVEIAAAAVAALAAQSVAVEAIHLNKGAGRPLAPAAAPPPPPPSPPPPTREQLEEALRRHGGNISAAARALAVHRTQLRRWLKKAALDRPSAARPADGGSATRSR